LWLIPKKQNLVKKEQSGEAQVAFVVHAVVAGVEFHLETNASGGTHKIIHYRGCLLLNDLPALAPMVRLEPT
jgi:hypothetical protein